MDIQSLGWAFVAFVVGLFVKSYLPSYFKKKGENLATKEDIADITHRIETVKLEYEKQLENAKADLSVLVTRHGFRYEKEYDVLGRLTELLVELREASLGLRPVFDVRDPELSAEQVKQQRLTRLYEAGRAVYLESHKKRPFFPGDIYDSIEVILNITNTESFAYRMKDPFERGEFLQYWEDAEKNQKEITQTVEEAMEKIRNRVIKWDSDRS
jgi:hypothetical protein